LNPTPEQSEPGSNKTAVDILVLGASGMLGSAVLRYFLERTSCRTLGSVRTEAAALRLPATFRSSLAVGVDVEKEVSLHRLLHRTRPRLIVNCVGLVKQLKEAQDPLAAIAINALLPHRLAKAAVMIGARLVHLSTDCVFAGTRGLYKEDDVPDATDIYGRSKLLGEVSGPSCITLRTSIVGQELDTHHSLLSWFLAQTDTVTGFRRAVFSGLPASEIARVIHTKIMPRPDVSGVWHLSSDPIDKFTLLTIIAKVYGRDVTIVPCDTPKIDRSLDSCRFRNEMGYRPASWTTLIEEMYEFESSCEG
jgi:dTDP-4-dehydrorhamnose reductase